MDAHKLKIITYNCFSIRKRVDIIRDLLDKCDILVCQETLLLENEEIEGNNASSPFRENFSIFS